MYSRYSRKYQQYVMSQYAPSPRPCIFIIMRSRFSFSYTSCCRKVGNSSCTTHV